MKKYQVFISSTYEDLQEERKEVIQALLELDCIPVGMELFPATDDDQWTLIKELIDDCDYYILIVGGRYGSINKDGISYTQQEYEYAVKIGIPIISFLHKNPDEITIGKTDKNEKKNNLLSDFRKLASKKLIKTWSTPNELGSIVSRSLIKLIKAKPRTGWVKANRISSEESSLEILKLKEHIKKLEDLQSLNSNNSIKNLSQGNDTFKIGFQYQKNFNVNFATDNVETTWNKLFSKTCTIFMDEGSEEEYLIIIHGYIKHLFDKNKFTVSKINIYKDTFMQIIIQFKALGLIEKSNKVHSVRDSNSYWKLTTKGDSLLTNLRAIKK